MATVLPLPVSTQERLTYPPGTIVIPCHDLARYHQFTHDMHLLDVPDGTIASYQRSLSIVQNLNEAVKAMLQEQKPPVDEAGNPKLDEFGEPLPAPPDSQWAWFIADDHCFSRTVVVDLLRRDVDIVVPLVCRRGPPYSLVIFDDERGEDEHGRTMYHQVQYDELPEDGGLFEVHAAGSAGMMVKRHVFEEIGFPWFENSDGISTNEDVEFCRKAREAGFKIWCDTDVRLGHLGAVAAWPARREGEWGIVFDFQGVGQNQIWMPGGVRASDEGVGTATGQVDW